MGKWCEVKCNCPNRIQVDPTRPSDRVYQCGHKDGALFQCWPGYIFHMGEVLAALFKDEPKWLQDFQTFLRISDWQNYKNECLMLSSQERDHWRLEVEQLQAFQKGEVLFSYHASEKWHAIWRDFFKNSWRQKDAVSVDEILATCIQLCDASVTSGNPIEFSL